VETIIKENKAELARNLKKTIIPARKQIRKTKKSSKTK